MNKKWKLVTKIFISLLIPFGFVSCDLKNGNSDLINKPIQKNDIFKPHIESIKRNASNFNQYNNKENNFEINKSPSFVDEWYHDTFFESQSNVGIIRNLEDFEKFSNGINPPQNSSEDILKGFTTNKINWKIFYENEILKDNFFDKNDLLYEIQKYPSITSEDIIDSIEVKENVITLNYVYKYSIWQNDYGIETFDFPTELKNPFTNFMIIPKLKDNNFVFHKNKVDRLEKYNTLRNKMPLGKYYLINE